MAAVNLMNLLVDVNLDIVSKSDAEDVMIVTGAYAKYDRGTIPIQFRGSLDIALEALRMQGLLDFPIHIRYRGPRYDGTRSTTLRKDAYGFKIYRR